MKIRLHLVMPLFFLLLLSDCRRPGVMDPPFVLDEISKSQRELLGKRLELALLTQPATYPLRSSAGMTNEVIFNYLQAYFDQASFLYKIDYQSPEDNRWDQNRMWRVRVLETDIPQSFCLPGGSFYISEGMLRALDSESQLFALMSFELTLMQEKYILKELSEQYVAEDFIDLLEIGNAEGSLDRQDLLLSFFNIGYEDFQVFSVDELTLEHICNSSAMKLNALEACVQALQQISANEYLFQKSYIGRVENLRSITPVNSCGSKDTDGSYQSMVLDLL